MKPVLAALLLLPALALTPAISVASAESEVDAYCDELYESVSRYLIRPTSRSPGGLRMRAEVARADCDAGRHARGIAILERLAENGRLPLPDRSSAERR